MKIPVKAIALNVALALGSILVTCVLAEVALRFARINTPSTVEFVDGKGLRRVPGARYVHDKEGHSEGRFNSHGFRDVERTLAKPPGAFRIEIFGDSFVDALQVALPDSFPARLERAIAASSRRVEVLNLGQSGFGTTDECLRFDHFGKAFSPDLVVVAVFVGNDIRNNSKTLNTESVTYYYVIGPDGRLELDTSLPDAYQRGRTGLQRAFQAVKRHSYLASLLSERLYLLRRAGAAKAVKEREESAASKPAGLPPLDDLNLFVDDAPRVWSDAWAVTQAVLLKFRDDAQAAGARFAVMTIPTAEQIDPAAQHEIETRLGRALDWDRPDALLVPFAKEHGIPMLALAPTFREAYARSGETLYGFGGGGNHGHWNERGHALAATTLLEFLEREGLLHD
jgi:hypothetical protein